jgi:hypothetical protein
MELVIVAAEELLEMIPRYRLVIIVRWKCIRYERRGDELINADEIDDDDELQYSHHLREIVCREFPIDQNNGFQAALSDEYEVIRTDMGYNRSTMITSEFVKKKSEVIQISP